MSTILIPLPDIFQKSCLGSKSYPSNYALKSLSTYPTALKVWRKRLQENAPEMFREPGATVHVPYRDLNAAGGKFEWDSRIWSTGSDLTRA